MGYFLFLAVFYIVSYFVVICFFQLFFEGKIKKFKINILDILIILFSYILIVLGAMSMIDLELANRLQHAIGGGFLMVLLNFLAYKSSGVNITKFQFFFISLMIATSFGVLNELAESIGQVCMGIKTFSLYIADTWFDLWSNTIGALFGVSIFVWFVGNKKKEK